MAATTIEALKRAGNNSGNVRKGLNLVAFLAPLSVDLPQAITTDSGQLAELPQGYLPMGLITKDGVSFTADVSTEEVEAIGYVEAVREDIVKVSKKIALTVLEPYRKLFQELVYGVDLSKTKASKTTGEIIFDETPLPVMRNFRLITVMADGPADDEWIIGRGYPKVKLGTVPEEAWKQTDATQFALEFTVFTDPVLGTPCRHYIGGTGTKRHVDALGFEIAD